MEVAEARGVVSARFTQSITGPEPSGTWTGQLSSGAFVGRFEILRELGRGGFGVVYEALDPELNRKVAIKVLRPVERKLELLERTRLREEAEAVAGLDHPGIVTLHDAGTCEAGPYLVFELLRGEPLDVLLARMRLDPLEALRIAGEVAKALAHAHQRGVLHRDLKPGNVFLTEDGRVKLLGFGLAHLLGAEDRRRGGTPAYMAPEQARGEAVDARADVFAFGVMAYEAAEGRLPFAVREGRSAVLDGEAPVAFTAKMPEAIASLITRCLSPDPAARPRSGEAIREELLAFQRARAVPASAPGNVGLEPPAASAAKISRPSLSPVFARSRLFQRLDVARTRPVVWVQGPPGAGKTTLVASYLETRRLVTLWYQLDEVDAEVGTFFHYLGVAARDTVPSHKPLPTFRSELDGNIDVFARRWFRELYARFGGQFVIVLDNYQTVAAQSALHSVVRVALEELSPAGNAIIVSRAEPLPAFARLRASGAVDVVSSEELRLTPAESNGIARVRKSDEYPVGEIGRLHERVQGWAAGLVLLLEGPGDEVAEAANDEPPEIVFDYFAGEILERMDDDTKRVLLETSLLPRFTAAMAERLTGVEQAGRIVAGQARRGYFTTRSGDRESHYQFHPLFREFLQVRLQESVSPEELHILRLKAARVLRDCGDAEAAIALYRQTATWDELTDVIVKQARALVEAGRAETLCRWITSIPVEERDHSAWLHYWLGMASLPLDPTTRSSTQRSLASRSFERAFDLFLAAGDGGRAAQSFVGVVMLMWAQAIDTAQLERWIGRFEQLQGWFAPPANRAIRARTAIAFFTALALWKPQHPDYREWRERLLRLARESPKRDTRLVCGSMLSHALLFKGELVDDPALLPALAGLASERDVPAPSAVIWLGSEALIHWCAGDYTKAIRAARKALAMSERFASTGFNAWLHVAEALAWVVADDTDEANAALQRARTAVGVSHVESALLEFTSGIVDFHSGRWDSVAEHSRVLLRIAERARVPGFVVIAHLLAARVLARAGQVESVATHLRAARETGAASDISLADFQAALIEAHLLLVAGDRDRAAESLRLALPMSDRRMLGLHHLWFSRAETAALCALAAERGLATDRVERLFAREPAGRPIFPDGPDAGASGHLSGDNERPDL